MTSLNVPEPRTFGPLTRTDFVRYQGASGDMNPIHHDDEFATAAGLPGVISVGMYQAGLLATWATDWLGAENVRKYRARFRDMVLPGDVLTCSGTIVQEYFIDGEQHVDIELTCSRQTGGVAIQAWATFALEGNPHAPNPNNQRK